MGGQRQNKPKTTRRAILRNAIPWDSVRLPAPIGPLMEDGRFVSSAESDLTEERAAEIEAERNALFGRWKDVIVEALAAEMLGQNDTLLDNERERLERKLRERLVSPQWLENVKARLRRAVEHEYYAPKAEMRRPGRPRKDAEAHKVAELLKQNPNLTFKEIAAEIRPSKPVLKAGEALRKLYK